MPCWNDIGANARTRQRTGTGTGTGTGTAYAGVGVITTHGQGVTAVLSCFVSASHSGKLPSHPLSAPQATRGRIANCARKATGRNSLTHPDPACGPDLVRVGSPRRHSARPRPFQAASAGLCVPGHVVRPAVRPGNRGVAIYGHGCGVNSSKAGSAAPPLLMRPPRDRLARHGPASTSSWSMPC